MSETIVEVTGVVKHFGAIRAVDGIDLAIERGVVYALLGPNGAGKTTTVSIIVGLRRPDRGTVSVFGLPPGHRFVRERLGVMLQDPPLPNLLKVWEAVELYRSYYSKPLSTTQILEIAGIVDLRDRLIARLSGGQRRRVALALALAGDPDLLILDEPTVGLDVEARQSFWKWADQFTAQGGTILLTTHYLEEADRVAQRLAVIAQGRIIAEGAPAAIKRHKQQYRVSFQCAQPLSVSLLESLPGVVSVDYLHGRYTLTVLRPEPVVAELFSRGIATDNLQVGLLSLEEVFLDLVQGEG